MAISIRPEDLPAAGSVTPGAALIIDNGVTVEKATPIQIMDAARPLASQSDAETGTDNAKVMSALRVAQAIVARAPAALGDATTAAQVGSSGPSNVQSDLNNRPTSAMLSSSTGASLIGYGSRTVADELGERIPITRASGIVGDGTTDDSAAVRAFLGANKGKTIIFPQGRKFLVGGILMSGSAWSGTRLIIEPGCELFCLPKDDDNPTLQNAWAMFAFQACSDIGIDVRGWLNGNRANQPASQYAHVVMLAGVTDFDIPNYRVREYRGDGLYITSENADGTGANSARGTIGSVVGYNSEADGRNLVSIISLTDSSFTSIRGVNVGGIIDGGLMPGGFDIEPDNANQLIENISVGSINVTGVGSTMIAIHGRPETTDRCKNITIGQSNVVNNREPSANDENGNLTQSSAVTLKVRWCEDVTIADHRGRFPNTYGNGVEVFCATRAKVRAQVSHVNTALITADSGYTVQTVTDPDVQVDAFDIARYGHSLTDIKGGRISGRLSAPSSAYYSNRFGVRSGSSLTDCILSSDVVADANWTISYRHTSGATYSNAVIADCDLSGAAWAGQLNRVGDMPVSRHNVAGVTDMASIPTGGTWKAGDFVRCNVATVGTGKVLLGWKRLTDGNAHVLNTDWKEVWGTDS